MGQPRRVKPPRVVGMSDGREESEASDSSGMKGRDFARFRWSPTEGPSSSIIRSAAARSSGDPIRVPSSRYQAFRTRTGTSVLMCSTTGCSARENPNGSRRVLLLHPTAAVDGV